MSHVSPKAWINVMQCKMETGRARSPWHLWEAWKLFSSSLWRYRMWSCWGPATAWTAGACLRRSHGVRKLLEGALSEDLSSFFFCKGLSWLGFWGPLPACRRCFHGSAETWSAALEAALVERQQVFGSSGGWLSRSVSAIGRLSLNLGRGV